MAYVKNINGYDIKDEEGRNLISALDQRVTDLHAPYYVLIGDSYGYDAVRDGTSITGWTSRIMSRYGLTENTDCFVQAEAGAGVYNPADSSGRNFAAMITYKASLMTQDQREKVGHVVIAGGTNDMSATALAADYNTLFATIRTNVRSEFPNAKITVVPVGMSNASRSARLRAPALYAKWQEACYGLGINFAWGAWFYRYDKRLETSDHVHINNSGERYCAAMISNAIEGSSCGYYARETATITLVSPFDHVYLPGDVSSPTFDIEIILQDGLITFNVTHINRRFVLAQTTQMTLNASYKTVGTITSDILPNSYYIVNNTSGRVLDSDGDYYDVPVNLSYSAGSFSIAIPYTDGLTGWKTANVDMINIDLTDFTTAIFTA